MKYLAIPQSVCVFSQITLELDAGFTKYDEDSNAHHEAAFDAYITGHVFLAMGRQVTKRTVPKDMYYHSDFINDFNKINLFRMNGKAAMYIYGDDGINLYFITLVLPERPRTFFVSGVPDTMMKLELANHFGNEKVRCFVSYHTKTSYFIDFPEDTPQDYLDSVLNDQSFNVITFADYVCKTANITTLDEQEEITSRKRKHNAAFPDFGFKCSVM